MCRHGSLDPRAWRNLHYAAIPDRWLLGVQWHAEDDDGSMVERERLFRAFLEG